MRFHSALSDQQDTLAAADALIADVLSSGLRKPDLLLLFITAQHTVQAEEILQKIHQELSPTCLIGASAEGVIGLDKEIERAPGLALLAGDLGGASVKPFHIGRDDWRKILTDDQSLPDLIGQSDQTRALIGFGEPFSTPIRQLLERVDEKCAGIPLIGGMASSGRKPGENLVLM